MTTLESRFDVLYRADFGGTLLQFLLADIAANFHEDDPKDVALVDLMSLLEEVLIAERVLPSDFAFFVLSPASEHAAGRRRDAELPERLDQRPPEPFRPKRFSDELEQLGLHALPQLRVAVEVERESGELVGRLGDEDSSRSPSPSPSAPVGVVTNGRPAAIVSMSLSLIPAPKRSGWTWTRERERRSAGSGTKPTTSTSGRWSSRTGGVGFAPTISSRRSGMPPRGGA